MHGITSKLKHEQIKTEGQEMRVWLTRNENRRSRIEIRAGSFRVDYSAARTGCLTTIFFRGSGVCKIISPIAPKDRQTFFHTDENFERAYWTVIESRLDSRRAIANANTPHRLGKRSNKHFLSPFSPFFFPFLNNPLALNSQFT